MDLGSSPEMGEDEADKCLTTEEVGRLGGVKEADLRSLGMSRQHVKHLAVGLAGASEKDLAILSKKVANDLQAKINFVAKHCQPDQPPQPAAATSLVEAPILLQEPPDVPAAPAAATPRALVAAPTAGVEGARHGSSVGHGAEAAAASRLGGYQRSRRAGHEHEHLRRRTSGRGGAGSDASRGSPSSAGTSAATGITGMPGPKERSPAPLGPSQLSIGIPASGQGIGAEASSPPSSSRKGKQPASARGANYGGVNGVLVGQDENPFFCSACGDSGDITCCDKCPRVFH